jgi:uncharacterized protein (TIGR00369 family)
MNETTAQARSGPHRQVPFIRHLGAVRESAADGQARITLELRPELLNNHHGGHGGVVMTLLDCAMAHAALSKVDYARELVTISMQVNFMRPATGRLLAVGRVTGGGRSVCFCEAHILDTEGAPTAHALGTFRYRQLAPSVDAAPLPERTP